jgi:aryl-alcohol dehydrogenase-like predicted oxidoreductase
MRLTLGTAQFGLDYGVAKQGGRNPQVTREMAAQILRYSERVGIRMLDTAIAYGESESVLGSIGVNAWNVVTKLPSPPINCADLTSWMLQQTACSAKRLGVDRLYAVLLHDPSSAAGILGAEYGRALRILKGSGLVSKVGFSIYSPDVLERLVGVFWPDFVQAPYNVMDTRISSSGWLRRLKDGGTEVHARSAFLQGVLLMSGKVRPAYFGKWQDAFEKWDAHVASTGKAPVHAALGAILADPMIDSIVVGVQSVNHLEQIVAAVAVAETLPVWRCPVDDPQLVDPFRWHT